MTWHLEYLYGASDEWFMPCAVCGAHLEDGVEAWVRDDEHGNGEFARCLSHGTPDESALTPAHLDSSASPPAS